MKEFIRYPIIKPALSLDNFFLTWSPQMSGNFLATSFYDADKTVLPKIHKGPTNLKAPTSSVSHQPTPRRGLVCSTGSLVGPGRGQIVLVRESGRGPWVFHLALTAMECALKSPGLIPWRWSRVLPRGRAVALLLFTIQWTLGAHSRREQKWGASFLPGLSPQPLALQKRPFSWSQFSMMPAFPQEGPALQFQRWKEEKESQGKIHLLALPSFYL